MDFTKVKNLMDCAVEKHCVPGSDILVTYQNRTVYRYQNGTKDEGKKKSVKGDELYFLYSATKLITCTAALQLVERGKIGLDDELEKYLPEYREMKVLTENGLQRCQTPIRLKHLFTMTSGIDYDLERKSILDKKAANPNASTLEMVKAFAKEPLKFEPGSHFCYGLSHDVLAAVVELAADQSFGEYLKKNIFDVCEMEHTGFEFNDEIRSRICSQFEYDSQADVAKLIGKENPFVLTPAYESGGAGLISCVDDYGKFITELANGTRLLKKETIDLMRQDHLNSQAKQDFVKKGYSYGLGVRTDVEGNGPAKGEFGWDGAAGAYALVDPDHHIAVFYATHIRNHGDYLYDQLHLQIRDAVYEAIREGKQET